MTADLGKRKTEARKRWQEKIKETLSRQQLQGTKVKERESKEKHKATAEEQLPKTLKKRTKQQSPVNIMEKTTSSPRVTRWTQRENLKATLAKVSIRISEWEHYEEFRAQPMERLQSC